MRFRWRLVAPSPRSMSNWWGRWMGCRWMRSMRLPHVHRHTRFRRSWPMGLRAMVERGAGAIAVCCAGDFPDIDCGAPVLYPGRLLAGIAGAVAANRRIGVVSPIESQMESARKNWERDGFSVAMTYASAFKRDEFERAARVMSDSSLELVVLDCMDHTAADRDEFARLCGRPVLAALPLTAQVASEIIGG